MTEQSLEKPKNDLWIYEMLEEVYKQALHSGKLDICLQALRQYKEMKDNG